MAEMNGFGGPEAEAEISASASGPSVADKTEFTLGGTKVMVRPMSLYDLKVCKLYMDPMNGDMPATEYAELVIYVIAYLTSPEDSPKEICEARAVQMLKQGNQADVVGLIGMFNTLLTRSGFPAPGEAAAGASPGTGTSTESSPNSLPAESAPATPIASGEPSH